MSEPGRTQLGSGAEFSIESGDPELNSERAFVARSSRGRSEVPIQDDQDRVFDMTVADSPDEVDIDEVAQPVRDVPRGRRVVLVPQSGTPRSVHNRSDAGVNESDTDSLDFAEENGSVVSGVEEPPLTEDVLEMDELQGTSAGFREALQAMDEVNLDVVFRRANVMKSVPHILKGPIAMQ